MRSSDLLAAIRPGSGSFSGEVLQSFATTVAGTGMNVVSGVLLARLLGAEGRGHLTAIQMLPMLVATMGQLGMNEAVIYFGGRDRPRTGRYAVSAAALTVLAGLPIALLAAWAVPSVFIGYPPRVVWACQISMALLFVNAIDGIGIATARARHDIPLWNVLRMAPRGLWMLLVVFCFMAGIADPVVIALAYLAAYAALAPFLIAPVRRHLAGAWRPDPKLWPELLGFGLPVAAGVAPRLLNERIDQLAIATLLPARELGLYSVAVGWTGMAQLPALTMVAVAFSKMAGMVEHQAKVRFLCGNLWAVGAATGGVALILGALTPWAMGPIYGKEFVSAVPLAWVMFLAVMLRSLAWMLQTGFQACGRPVLGMVSQWVGLAALVVCAVLLVPGHGALGAAWSLVAASTASLAVAVMLAPRGLRAQDA